MPAVAAAAGYGATGLWFDPATWTHHTTNAVASSLSSHGIVALDIEPVILGRAVDPGDQLVDVAMELGVRSVLVASGPAERGHVVERLAHLAERTANSGVMLALEFLPIFSVGTLDAAQSIVSEVGAPHVGVLIDTLHLDRSGGTVEAVARAVEAHPDRFPYLQLADAVAERPVTRDSLRDEALHGRLLPGDGSLPLAAVLRAVPGVPVSVELRSNALIERFPDPVERAARVLAATSSVLDES
jgi:sugar phosphate isomerase/epimerase